MSAGSLGAIGSLAAGQLQQTRAADAERGALDNAAQSRSESTRRQAEAASGIGQTEQDSEASERDADGRRLWERPLTAKSDANSESPAELSPLPRSRDATGESGTRLDLDG